jgi:hypothetical protein
MHDTYYILIGIFAVCLFMEFMPINGITYVRKEEGGEYAGWYFTKSKNLLIRKIGKR